MDLNFTLKPNGKAVDAGLVIPLLTKISRAVPLISAPWKPASRFHITVPLA